MQNFVVKARGRNLSKMEAHHPPRSGKSVLYQSRQTLNILSPADITRLNLNRFVKVYLLIK